MEGFDRCPIEMALDYIRNKWTFEIVRDLFLGKKRFSEFQKGSKISKNVLSERLKDLVKKGIVEKIINEELAKMKGMVASLWDNWAEDMNKKGLPGTELKNKYYGWLQGKD